MRRITWNLQQDDSLDNLFGSSLNQVLDHWVHQVAGATSSQDQNVRLDVWENGDQIILEAELAGVEPENISIEVAPDGRVEIEAKPSNPALPQGGTWIRRERTGAPRKRSLQLPCRLDPSNVEARLRNGHLVVEIRKHLENQPRKIVISKD